MRHSTDRNREGFQDRGSVRSSDSLANRVIQGLDRFHSGLTGLDSPPAENVRLRWRPLCKVADLEETFVKLWQSRNLEVSNDECSGGWAVDNGGVTQVFIRCESDYTWSG